MSRRTRRFLLAAGGVVVVGVLAWFAWGSPTGTLRWQDVGFSVQGPDAVVVTYEVTKAPDAWAQCRLEALSESYAQVGVTTVTIGPAENGTDSVQRFRTTVPTAELATTAVVNSCQLLENPPG